MRGLLPSAIVAAALSLVSASAIYAHHSYAATYDTSKEVRLEGKLVQLVLRNPHSYVTLMAPDAKGAMQRWSVEWSAPTQLGNQGVSRETLHVGDELIIVGRPSRVTNEYRALMLSLRRPSDGFEWGTRGEKVD